jgi:hypothetical protein
MAELIEGVGEVVSEEQAADLARLTMQAGEGQDAGPIPEAEPAGPTPEESLAGLLTLAGMAAGMAGMTRTAGVWGADTCRGFAERAVPVLAKYGWGQRVLGFLQDGAGVEEMALLAFAAPVALATWQAARADLAPARDEKPVEGDPVPARPAPAEPDAGQASPVVGWPA